VWESGHHDEPTAGWAEYAVVQNTEDCHGDAEGPGLRGGGIRARIYQRGISWEVWRWAEARGSRHSETQTIQHCRTCKFRVCTLQFLPRSQGSSRKLIAQSLQIRAYGIGKFWDVMNIPPLSLPNNVSTQDGAHDLVSWIYNGRSQFLWESQKLSTYLGIKHAWKNSVHLLSIHWEITCWLWYLIFYISSFSFFFVSLIETLNPPYLLCFVEVAMIVAKSYPLIFSVFLPFLYLFLLCFFDQNPKPSFSCMFHWGSHDCCQVSSIDIFGISSFSRW